MTGNHDRLFGLDLAGSEKRPSGICLLQGNRADVSILYTDEEILRAIGDRVQAVAIDAPLSLPKGRCCLRDECACFGKAHFRLCDLELRRMKIRFFPITLGPMRKLTLRGIAAGIAELRAERQDLSIIRIPSLPVSGQPVSITVL